MGILTKLPGFFHISEDQLLEITPLLFEKDYSSAAVTFLEHPSRTLNYWGSEPNILPPGGEPGKRRRYSFFDMLWLKLVSELRDFGLEKPALAILKAELLTPINMEEMNRKLQADREGMEELMREKFQYSEEDIKMFFDTLSDKQSKIEQLQATKLFAHTMYSLGQQKVIRLIISKAGHFYYYSESDLVGLYHVERDSEELGNVYCVVNLTNLITQLLCMEPIKDTFKQAFFTREEWDLLKFLRGEKPVSVKVDYKGDRIDLVHVTRNKRVNVEARLSEVLLKKEFETITIENIKGKIITYSSTVKHKL